MDMEIVREEKDARHGRYAARVPGIDAVGEITFTRRGADVISADHTGVPDALGGRGIARALVDFMVEDARAGGFRIIPLCPYVRAQYARHPEWAAVFTTRPGEDPPGA